MPRLFASAFFVIAAAGSQVKTMTRISKAAVTFLNFCFNIFLTSFHHIFKSR